MRYKLYALGELPILQINAAGYSSDTKDTTFGPRRRDLFLIGYVLSGRGVYNNHELGQGQGFIVTPDITEHICPDKDEPWELLWFTSVDRKMGELLKYYNADEKTYIFQHSSPAELDEIKRLIIADHSKTISDGKMLELFFSLFKYHTTSGITSSADRSAAERYISFSLNYIRANYDRNITISKLTTVLGVSQPYLYKIFKEAFGKSPKTFITEYRINQAKGLLTETDLSIAEIASSVGFSDSFAFSKSFSAREGLSPTKYRNLHKNTA